MSEWIEWNGGECPVHESTKVDLRYKNGSSQLDMLARVIYWDAPAIFAYRLSEQKSMEEAYDETTRGIVDSALDVQISGDHYKKLKIQPIEYIHANNIPFPEGTAIKYVTRWRDKGGIADLRKAIHIIEMLIELEGK